VKDDLDQVAGVSKIVAPVDFDFPTIATVRDVSLSKLAEFPSQHHDTVTRLHLT
jgi:hypothetical protein